MVMGTDMGANIFKRKKKKPIMSTPDAPRKAVPTGAKKVTPTVGIPDVPRKPIPAGATKVTTPTRLDGTPSKTMPAKPRILDGTPSKTIPSSLTATAVGGGAPRQRKPRAQSPDLMKSNPNGGSTLSSAMTVGKELTGMASIMRNKRKSI